MCFNQPASLLLACIGFSICYFGYKQKTPFHSYMLTLFYAGMELLQFVQYFYISECSLQNSVLTKIAYVYIWLQPIAYNCFYYLTNQKAKIVFKYNIYLSILCFLYAMDRVFYKVLHRNSPRFDEISSSPSMSCTYGGDKHLYWLYNLATNNGLEMNYVFYLMLICFPALWSDDIRVGIYLMVTFLSGLLVALWYTRHIEQAISFWCLLSVPYLMVSHIVKKYI